MKELMKCKIIVCACLLCAVCMAKAQESTESNLDRARLTLESIYKYYSAQGTALLHENYPFDANYSATYLASADTGAQKQFAYLWPFSGTFSGVNALLRSSGDKQYLKIMTERVLDGLEKYYDHSRQPPCYASYLSEAGLSDRFYDDNVWLGIDFVELYRQTKNASYLDKAKEIWTFILSGTDEKLGGGIYWCEQKKHSKNTCSNAPGSVLALKLFEATKDSSYFKTGLELYHWTKKNLQDPEDLLYWDNINLSGKIGKAKYPYNSGQMLQSAALLYKLTRDKRYLVEAQAVAKAGISHFTHEIVTEQGEKFRLINPGNIWFVAVMMRGFIELYHQDQNKEYLEVFNKNLDYAWKHARDKHGLFFDHWDGKSDKQAKWLLDQAAFVEMYASIAGVDR